MTSSKFVEILDSSNTPTAHANVSLEDILAETRQRSESSSSASTSGSMSSAKSPVPSPVLTQPAKTRLRAFSLRKSKS